MEIVTFFEKLAGKWFSQRTTHYLTAQRSQAGKSDLNVEFMPASAPAVQALCAELAAEPNHALCGLKVSQTSTIEGDPKPRVSSTLVVPLTPEHGTAGRLLRKTTTGNQPSISHYSLDNEILIISTEDDTTCSEERWWFITDNLRMRTSILNRKDGVQLASFCSEIRLGNSQPAS